MFIVVGVTGGIAAYKTVQLVRLLVKDGHDVHVVPTDDALRFVGMPTWEAISRNRVTTSVHDDVAQVRHVALGQQADLVVVAPAMHTEMWRHPATQANIDTLTSRGVHMIGPVSGELTGGDSGPGRVSEPEDVHAAIRRELEQRAPGSAAAAGTRWLVTAGGTREPLDPVRYIGNRSSGRQGLEVARAAAARGADVTLVAVNMDPGLVRVTPETVPGAAEGSYASHESGIRILTASSTEELRDVVREEADQHDVVVMAAAVSDYRAADVAQDKMRKEDTGGALSIELVETPDILAEIAASRREGQTIVGFAAETPGETTLAERAFAKRERKGCDLLAANEVGWDRGFERDDNHLLVVDEAGIVADVAGTKRETAEGLVTAILAR